ncbi:MAG: ferredoxin [Armatimonadota bacterium]
MSIPDFEVYFGNSMWYKAIPDTLQPSEFRTVEIDQQRILIGRTSKGYFAVRDLCSHQRLPLSEADGTPGKIEHDLLVCPHHGARYDPHTGQARGLPAIRPIQTYAVKVEDGFVWVQLT